MADSNAGKFKGASRLGFGDGYESTFLSIFDLLFQTLDLKSFGFLCSPSRSFFPVGSGNCEKTRLGNESLGSAFVKLPKAVRSRLFTLGGELAVCYF